MAKLATDLSAAAGLSDPTKFTDLLSSGLVPPDFEIDGCSLIEDSSGPYEPGERIQLKMTFSGQENGHSGNISGYSGNYTETGSSGGEITPASTTIYPFIEYDVDSGAADGDYTIYATYDEVFNSGATNVGTQQSVTVTVKGFAISLAAAGSTSTSMSLSLDITSGSPDYNVLIERSDTSGGPYDTTVVNTTETSTGTYSYSDSGLNSGTTYYYKATVTDNSGNGDTLTDTASGTTLQFL